MEWIKLLKGENREGKNTNFANENVEKSTNGRLINGCGGFPQMTRKKKGNP